MFDEQFNCNLFIGFLSFFQVFLFMFTIHFCETADTPITSCLPRFSLIFTDICTEFRVDVGTDPIIRELLQCLGIVEDLT